MRVIEKEPSSEVKQEDVGDKEEMETDEAKDVTEAEVECKDEEVVYPPDHPYIYELSQFKPHSWQLEENEPDMYSSLEDTKFTMIDSQSLLEEMIFKLKKVKEIAIGLEHHSYRSFLGMVCLLQISTRTEDFLIDSLILKDELIVLNKVCTDSNILKVLHGSEHDLEWLQKDFGVYVINMFDTKKAAGVLQEECVSLAGILKKYCHVELNKEYQRTDWRVRPVPDEMVKYARQDSHYLLYIHDVFRNSLLKRGKGTAKVLEDIYSSCSTACSVVWYPEKHVFHSELYLTCYKKMKGTLNIQQLECFRLLYEWRYKFAQENDESTGYVMSNKLIMMISTVLPKEAQGVIECCDPVNQSVEDNLEDVHKCVLQAIENVPEAPAEPVDIKKLISKGKPSQRSVKNLKKRKRQSKQLPKGGNRGGMKRGGAWNGGFAAYPPAGPRMRGGPGFRNLHGRGSRDIGPTQMHPYGHPHLRQSLPTDHYYGFGGHNSGGNPYNVPFNPYNHPSGPPNNTGRDMYYY